jgi:hypothetical protein
MKIQGSSAFNEITGENNIVATISTFSQKFNVKFQFDIKVPVNHEEMAKIKTLSFSFIDEGIIQDNIENYAKSNSITSTSEQVKKQIINAFSLMKSNLKTFDQFILASKEIIEDDKKNSLTITIKSKSDNYVDLSRDMQNIAILLMLQNIQGIEKLLLEKFQIDIFAE